MEAKLQRRVQRYGWDRASSTYERYWSRQLEPAQSLLLQSVRLRPGERVVDIACGTGLVTLRAAEAVGPAGYVFGTDLSEAMVEAAATGAQVRGLRQMRFARMDAEQLELSDESFDVALNALGLMYAPDPLRAAREMFRVVRRGGRAGACVWGARAQCGWAEIFPIVDRRVNTDVCPLFFRLGTADVLADTLREAGFVGVGAERIRVSMHYASADDALGAAFVGGPVALAYARFGSQTRKEVHAEYLASIEPYRDGDAYRIPGEFVVVRGTRP